MSVRFSPDGARLFSGGSDSQVRVWDARSGEPITILPCGTALLDRYAGATQIQKASQNIPNLVFSPDGSILIACGYEFTNIFLWNTATYTLKTVIDPEQWRVHSVAFSDNGKTFIAQGGWDKLFGHLFWSVDTGEMVDSLVMFAPYDRTPPPIGKNNIWAREDDSKESQVVFKNVLTGETLAVAKHPDMMFNRDRTRYITRAYEGSIELWDVNHKQRIAQSRVFYQINASFGYGIFSPDSKQFAIGSYYSGCGAYIWDVHTGEALGTIPRSQDWAFGNGGNKIFFRPDGTLLLIGCHEVNNQQHRIEIWDLLKHTILAEFTCPKESILDRITNFVISPNWKLLVTGSESGPLRIWNLETGEHYSLWKKPGQKIAWIGFSPDGTHISIVTDDHVGMGVLNMVARLINLRTGKEIFSTTGFTANFTPDGTTLLIMSREENKDVTQVWNIHHRQKIGLLPRITANAWFSFTSDGQVVLIPHYNSFQCWDWQQQQELAWIYLPDTNHLYDVAISPDGKMIAIVLGGAGDVLLYGVPVD
ncbi:MAG: WD40 repeat domain-containing protein, partial [Anaerolineae bacterium]|nr:WD40 repeat domain-containing protein [Anaerolineae bacterium]